MQARPINKGGAAPQGPAAAPKKRWDLVQLLLIAMIVYIPNQMQFRVEFSIKGLNIVNVLFLWTWGLLWLRGIHSRHPPPLRGPLYLLFAIMTLALCIGLGYDSSQAMEDVTAFKNMIFFILLYFLYYRAVQDMETVRLLFAVILFVTFVASIQGLRQALDYGIASYNETRRVSAPFGWGMSNANRAAVFFVVYLPLFAAVGMYYTRSAWVRLGAYACLGLGVFVVFFTYSRQAYFILALLALVLTFRKSWLVGLIICLVLVNYEAWAPDTVIQRIQSTEQTEAPAQHVEGAGEGKYDESTESRLVIWAAAGELITERPWGIGLNHFKREIGTYAPRYQNMDAHNVYVLTTTEAGIQGVIALAIVMLALLFMGLRAERMGQSMEGKILGVAFTTSVMGVMLGNIYGSRFFDGDVMGNFWIFAALVARFMQLERDKAAAAGGRGKRPDPADKRGPLTKA